jgi:putative phosphoribosyl transferase
MFDLLTRRFQFRFKNRITAANILGESLKDIIKKEIPHVVIVGIARGGVLTADIVARKLSAPGFDIVIPRKLTDPDNKEQAIGAIMEDGTTYIDEQLIRDFQISSEYLEKEKSHQIEEIRRRTALFLGNDVTRHNFENKIVILVDDGAATGATIIAAARSIRKRFAIKRLIIALPIAPKNTIKLLRQEADTIEVVTSPSTHFHSVGQFYQDSNPVSDQHVMEILRNRGLLS